MTDHTVERWLPVPGYEDRYEVSDQGRVRSLIGPAGPRIAPYVLAATIGKHGYRHVTLLRHQVADHRMVHWLVLLAFVGVRPEGMDEIRHLNGDPTDNRLANLKYGTRSENQQDSIRHGTQKEVRKTHCVNGHPLSGANLHIRGGDGARVCVECRRESKRRYRARHLTAR